VLLDCRSSPSAIPLNPTTPIHPLRSFRIHTYTQLAASASASASASARRRCAAGMLACWHVGMLACWHVEIQSVCRDGCDAMRCGCECGCSSASGSAPWSYTLTAHVYTYTLTCLTPTSQYVCCCLRGRRDPGPNRSHFRLNIQIFS
jgi:hypothetical protein